MRSDYRVQLTWNPHKSQVVVKVHPFFRHWSNLVVPIHFPDFDSIPLPETVRQRMWLLDMALCHRGHVELCTVDSSLPCGALTVWDAARCDDPDGLDGLFRYILELTQTEYDRLVAELGGYHA